MHSSTDRYIIVLKVQSKARRLLAMLVIIRDLLLRDIYRSSERFEIDWMRLVPNCCLGVPWGTEHHPNPGWCCSTPPAGWHKWFPPLRAPADSVAARVARMGWIFDPIWQHCRLVLAAPTPVKQSALRPVTDRQPSRCHSLAVACEFLCL